jgi:predicted nucleic acid-binding protein
MIIVDTGFLLALVDRRDIHHTKALLWRDSAADGWVTTWAVITEAYYMISERLSVDAALDLIQECDGGSINIWDIPLAQLGHMRKLLSKYKQLPMDLADASLVMLAEHLGHGRILTTDQRDFGAYRWKSRKPFTDLMAA